MKLPKNVLSNTYTKPRLFLCETDGSIICQLENSNLSGNFSFNSISEINFEVSRFYNDTLTGETKVNPFYDKVEGLRLVKLEGFGMFEIQGPSLSGDGISEKKTVNAKSLEYTLSNKYLKKFYINTGETGAVEVTYAQETYGDNFTADQLETVSFYNINKPSLSLLHLILSQAYGWTLGHVDDSLKTQTRKFEIDRQSIYDFITNDLCESFNCYVVFDTLQKTMSFYAESLTSKFIGDGETTQFTISPPFSQIHTVSVDGYKTTQWSYNGTTGVLTLEEAPDSGSHIEVVDAGLEAWETDVFITFDNLSQSIDVNYDADSIKTVLTVTYGEDENIREVNFGSSDLVDLSYYHTVDWMGQELYDRYTQYLQQQNTANNQYAINSQAILEIENQINFEKNKLSLTYGIAQAVTSTTVGEYYVRRGTDPNYYFVQVNLPEDYQAGTTYYKDGVANINEDKVGELYSMLKKYFYAKEFGDEEEDDQDDYDEWYEYFDDEAFVKDFQFVSTELNTLRTGLNSAFNEVRNNKNYSAADSYIKTFLNRLWSELGQTPLNDLYLEPYKQVQATNIEAGWSEVSNKNYPRYYPVLLMLSTIEGAINIRKGVIQQCKAQQAPYQTANNALAQSLNMSTFFTESQLVRLNAFLREDELNLDDIITTDLDSLADSFKVQQSAMESGKIELNKLCQPQLNFSMSMANIYAIPEFEPIINQFQLGNVIKIALRDDYIKQSRLLSVDIDFEDLSNFSVEFGELTSLTRQSDIHADLLSQAIQAGKEVASSAGIWQSGADTATELDLIIQNGLISATNSLKSMDSLQAVEWDNYGIHMRKWMDSTQSEYDDKQAWITNNQLMFTDDGWKTSRAGFGEFTIYNPKTKQYEDMYGLVADTVVGNLILSKEMGIYSKDNTITLDEDGLTISTDNADANTSMLTIQKTNQNGSIKKLLYVDSDGQLVLNGSFKVFSNTDDSTSTLDQIVEGTQESVQSVDVEYYKSTSTTQLTGGSWSTTSPAWEDGKYIWSRNKITTANGTITYSEAVCITGNDGTDGQSSLSVQIESSNGNIFRGANLATTLTCKVYYGTLDVTNRVTKFTWQKRKEDGTLDTSWSRTGAGNTITLTNADVLNQANFTCSIEIDL